jgi:hypothetical protein
MQMEVRFIAVVPSDSFSPSFRVSGTPSAMDSVFLVLVGLVSIAAITTAMYACIPKVIQISFSPKMNHKAPCYRCQYFSDNPYVKCALHPDTALTEEAVDCRDYQVNSMAEHFEE